MKWEVRSVRRKVRWESREARSENREARTERIDDFCESFKNTMNKFEGGIYRLNLRKSIIWLKPKLELDFRCPPAKAGGNLKTKKDSKSYNLIPI